MIDSSIRSKKDVVSVIQQHQAKIKAFGVKKLGLFGSFSRDEQNSESDIDLLVEFEEGQKTFDNFMRLSFLLEELLKWPVELVTVESVSPYLRPYITQEVDYDIVWDVLINKIPQLRQSVEEILHNEEKTESGKRS